MLPFPGGSPPEYGTLRERKRFTRFAIALGLFTLMELVVRRQLAEQKPTLAGLYDGNPKRTTNRPTAERLLSAFCGITWYFHRAMPLPASPNFGLFSGKDYRHSDRLSSCRFYPK